MGFKIDQKLFWNLPDVVASQDKIEFVSLFKYEKYLLKKILNPEFINQILVLGCGTGREIKGILDYFPNSTIIGIDFSSAMIRKCNENIHNWKINEKVKVFESSVEEYDGLADHFDLITTFASMLTYISNDANRNKIICNAYRMLKPGGYFVGVVHNQFGKPLKSIYFLLQKIYAPFLNIKCGDRFGGFYGKKVMTHYFTIKEIKKLLENKFSEIVVCDLKSVYKLKDLKYSYSGDNNIVFFARK